MEDVYPKGEYVTWFSLIVVRHADMEGGNLDLAHETKEIHKISKFLSNHGTFQCQNLMHDISINFRPSVST